MNINITSFVCVNSFVVDSRFHCKLTKSHIRFQTSVIDIAVLVARWFHVGTSDDLFASARYCVFRKDHTDGRRGGRVSLYMFVRNGLLYLS